MSEAPVITRVSVYRDVAEEFRFTAYSANGRAIVVSSEGYVNHLDAHRAARSLFPAASVTTIAWREKLEGFDNEAA